MRQLVGLYIEDEEKNIILMQGRFALKGIRIIGLGKFPQDLKNIYDYVIDNQVDFLIVDHELEKAYVTYKGIDMLKEIRKHDSNIYAVLLTNLSTDTYRDELGEYDFQLTKSELTSPKKFDELTAKIKRACMLRKDQDMLASMDMQKEQLEGLLKQLKDVVKKEP